MTQFVKEPTHISGNTLDLVLTRTSDNLVHSIQVGSQFSDHFAVHCKLNLQKPGYAKNLVSYRRLKAIINRTDFECDIENSELITSPKPDLTGLIKQYNETLYALLNKHAPIKSRSVTLGSRNPLYNEEITDAKFIKHNGFLVNTLIHKAKCSYYKDKTENLQTQRNCLRLKNRFSTKKENQNYLLISLIKI